MASHYQTRIAEHLARRRVIDIDPRHVEGYMRVQHNTLDRLSPNAFKGEIALCVRCIREGGVERAERNAQSFGL